MSSRTMHAWNELSVITYYAQEKQVSEVLGFKREDV